MCCIRTNYEDNNILIVVEIYYAVATTPQCPHILIYNYLFNIYLFSNFKKAYKPDV